MSGETRLDKLLAGMSPELQDGEFVICCFANAAYGEYSELAPIASIVEEEGLSLVIPRSLADANDVSYDTVLRLISLRVHSSLEAVGLTAAFSEALARRGISANVLAGYHHDHILVPSGHAQIALAALTELTELTELSKAIPREPSR